MHLLDGVRPRLASAHCHMPFGARRSHRRGGRGRRRRPGRSVGRCKATDHLGDRVLLALEGLLKHVGDGVGLRLLGLAELLVQPQTFFVKRLLIRTACNMNIGLRLCFLHLELGKRSGVVAVAGSDQGFGRERAHRLEFLDLVALRSQLGLTLEFGVELGLAGMAVEVHVLNPLEPVKLRVGLATSNLEFELPPLPLCDDLLGLDLRGRFRLEQLDSSAPLDLFEGEFRADRLLALLVQQAFPGAVVLLPTGLTNPLPFGREVFPSFLTLLLGKLDLAGDLVAPLGVFN